MCTLWSFKQQLALKYECIVKFLLFCCKTSCLCTVSFWIWHHVRFVKQYNCAVPFEENILQKLTRISLASCLHHFTDNSLNLLSSFCLLKTQRLQISLTRTDINLSESIFSFSMRRGWQLISGVGGGEGENLPNLGPGEAVSGQSSRFCRQTKVTAYLPNKLHPLSKVLSAVWSVITSPRADFRINRRN